MDAPPPPYSETDLYSTSGSQLGVTTRNGSGSGSSTSLLVTPSLSHDRCATVSQAGFSSTPSSADEVVYTPSYSPAASVYHNHAFSDENGPASSSAVLEFFEMRPATRPPTGPPLEYTIIVAADTKPADLPFPDSFLGLEVTDQDWATFLNYLLPDHISAVNNDVADRKLKAEGIDEPMSRPRILRHGLSSDISQAIDAQLEPLRQHHSSESGERTRKIESVIAEWNEGFFVPRGLRITTVANTSKLEAVDTTHDGEQTPRSMPGAWIPYDHELLGESSTSRSRKGFFSGFKGFQASSQGGFRIGPIVADNEGFRLGNMLVADQNGFRFGGSRGFVADGNGVSMGGRNFGRRESGDPERANRGRLHHGRYSLNDCGQRDRSLSSFSSVSSSSSSTDSSVGSLPEYEDLNDQQLPAAKRTLIEWLERSEHPITKQSIQLMRQSINSTHCSNQQHSHQDAVTLRLEVRSLMRQFREEKKTQKKTRRQLKRDRRALRRVKRAERRDVKREIKQEGRELRGARCSRKREDLWLPGRAHSKSTVELPQPSPPPKPPRPLQASTFPFPRVASVPFLTSSQLNVAEPSHNEVQLPGAAAMHGGWPYTQRMPFAIGNISTPHLPPGSFPEPIVDSAEQLHLQAIEMEEMADMKEESAIKLRALSTAENMRDDHRSRKLEEAVALEEEVEKYQREADRLRAEALHLDNELARGLEDEGDGQITGIIRG